jgi:hypothetical protein
MKSGGLRNLAMVFIPFLFASAAAIDRGPSVSGSFAAYANSGIPYYQPRRTRFKGYMRENRRCTFNKNK